MNILTHHYHRRRRRRRYCRSDQLKRNGSRYTPMALNRPRVFGTRLWYFPIDELW